MGCEWKASTLSVLADIQTGPFGSQLHASDYVVNGIPSIMPQNIGDNIISEQGIARISALDVKRLNRYLVKTGDIVYSRRGDVEKRALIRAHQSGWLCGTGCLRVRPNMEVIDPVFLSYHLGNPLTRAWIVQHAHGATMPNLNTEILSAVPIFVPSMEVQQSIAATLSCLDDKIVLNNKINANLEAQAQAIFKSWFVDFEPFQDSEFVDSELGRIPKGWRVVPLSEICYYVTEKVPVSSSNAEAYISTDNMLPDKKGIIVGSTLPSATNMTRYQPQDVLISNIRPYFKKIWYSNNSGGCSNDVLVFRAKQPLHSAFLYQLLLTDHFFDYVTSTSKGTKMPRGDKSAIMQYQVRFPIMHTELAVLEKFNNLIKPMLDIKDQNFTENSQLIKLRDTLLPKLMSGEIRL